MDEALEIGALTMGALDNEGEMEIKIDGDYEKPQQRCWLSLAGMMAARAHLDDAIAAAVDRAKRRG